jgi:hypothetical protein
VRIRGSLGNRAEGVGEQVVDRRRAKGHRTKAWNSGYRPAVMLLVTGVALTVVSFAWILPRPTSLGQPATFQLVVYGYPASVYLTVYPEPDTSDQVILLTEPQGQPLIGASLTVPPGTRVLSCGHPSRCTGGPSDPVGTLVTLSFTAKGTASVVVGGREVGYDSNGTTAYAQLPLVQVPLGSEPAAETPSVSVTYEIPNAKSYDWNTGPQPQTVGTGSITWSLLTATTGAGFQSDPVAVGGVDNAAQQRQSLMTFVAGTLLGIAGGALIGALQEAIDVRKDDEGNQAGVTNPSEAAQ